MLSGWEGHICWKQRILLYTCRLINYTTVIAIFELIIVKSIVGRGSPLWKIQLVKLIARSRVTAVMTGIQQWNYSWVGSPVHIIICSLLFLIMSTGYFFFPQTSSWQPWTGSSMAWTSWLPMCKSCYDHAGPWVGKGRQTTLCCFYSPLAVMRMVRLVRQWSQRECATQSSRGHSRSVSYWCQ